jgi:hypothetical protein
MPLFSANWNILFPIACSLLVGLKLAEGRSGLRGSGWIWAGLHTLVYSMMAMALAGVIIRVSLINILWLLILPVFIVIMLLKSRMLGRMALFASLTSVDSPPLAQQVARDFSRFNRGWLRRRAVRFVQSSEKGMDWQQSMRHSGIAKSPFELLLCGLIGTYGKTAFAQIPTALHPLRIQGEFERIVGRLLVIPWLLLGMPVLFLIQLLLLPTFVEIFDEFQRSLGGRWGQLFFPSNTAFVISAGSVLGGFWMGCLAFFFLGYAAQLVPGLLTIIPFRWLFDPYHRALCLVALAVTSRAESGIGRACEVSSQILPFPHWSSRFQHARQRLDQGASLGESLQKAKLLTPAEAQALHSALDASSLCWFLQQMAIAHTDKMLRRYSVLVQIIVVSAVVSFAALYSWMIVGLIEALYSLVHHLSAG